MLKDAIQQFRLALQGTAFTPEDTQDLRDFIQALQNELRLREYRNGK